MRDRGVDTANEETKAAFWRKTRPADGGCLLWTGATTVRYNGRAETFFRVAYRLSHRRGLSAGRRWFVRRSCGDKRCVAPAHLYLETCPSTSHPHSYERLRVPTERQYGYIAGYFDGEGCLVVSANKTRTSWNLALKFGQVRREGLDLLHSIYGGKIRRPACRDKNKQQQWTWELAKKLGVKQFLLDVENDVLEKKAQVKAALRLLQPDLISAPFSSKRVRRLLMVMRADKVKARSSCLLAAEIAAPTPRKTRHQRRGRPAR
jgi:hypothetical protein